jgi:murein L,D-transpeptidase YcbB/YkuD
MHLVASRGAFPKLLVLMIALIVGIWTVGTVQAEVTAFKQAVAEAAAKDKSIAAFYKANGYKPIFTSNKDRGRRNALLKAFSMAGDHGLPTKRYKPEDLKAIFKAAKSERDRGKAEVAAAKMFVSYARDIQTGAVIPSRIDSGIVRKIPRRDPAQLLAAFAKSSPSGFLKSLTPRTPEYARLMKAKIQFEKLVAKGGWGAPVKAKSLKPGDSGASVVALRNRLIAMGYMKRNAGQSYDGNMQKAVQQFQLNHGLAADGVAGQGTITEANVTATKRLQQIIVAMERERWMNKDRGKRHVLVNITDFSAKIVDNGKVTFQTRSVVGANDSDRRTPEFSDVMEHMVINPTWNVPRSIATKEYLPLFKKNRNAAAHLRLIDRRGQVVNRANVNFAAFNENNFPFDIKQPPSRRNALGLVKFMFPNKHNIYLHDTPQKALFARESRAFSHGCVRLNDPFDFAYALLAKQEKDPTNFLQAKLKTGRETVVPLKAHVPVHLIYRTAFTQPKGKINFRRDIYSRDAAIFKALQNAGVVLRAVRS